ncbi:hypothetical protein [Lacticaseibacillus manihotivorans]|uniref:hypothetical protein n=1 Tax=Lacticaseibacillus manihotivorans TaxID=88233 RepID=UPI000A7E87E1|nr:hypothetical protein [Lacticaseibacillus manihotivorans]
MMDEIQHLAEIYQQLTTDVQDLTQKLADLQVEGRAMKQQLATEGHLDLGSMTETLDTFASIEANNRLIDTLNSRYDAAVVRLAHAQLLVPQAYFAKMSLDYGDGPEAFYLGKVGYADVDAHDLVYDWRARWRMPIVPIALAPRRMRQMAERFRLKWWDARNL